MIGRFCAKLRGYRTIVFNMVFAIMPILEMSEVLDILPDNYEAPYAILVAILNLYFRSITTTPMGRGS